MYAPTIGHCSKWRTHLFYEPTSQGVLKLPKLVSHGHFCAGFRLHQVSCVTDCDVNKGSVKAILENPLGLQEVEAPRISRQSAHEGGKVVSPTHRPSLPPEKIPCTHFC
jgi:hypothetical protein